MKAENNNEAKSLGRKTELKHKKLIITLSVILAVVLVLVSAFFIVRKIVETALRKNQ